MIAVLVLAQKLLPPSRHRCAAGDHRTGNRDSHRALAGSRAHAAGCPTNSSIADSLNGVLPHLKARDVTMICVSGAPLEKLLAYRERMGWSLDRTPKGRDEGDAFQTWLRRHDEYESQ